ncbi:mannan-binding family protein [Mycolicibacterium pyrenivorans]|uniref:mannan-binding family protein n=1 Tax=Mycolicibacterium pyrenivorans TaxID=187102 RepID=UPI0021F2F9BC|nr:mannan-binding family protein [Mycolicibacterium pyrenivorans]MCV7154304.1 mannan-binding family protein [Mycolicibacterium pyrenivorans]
MRRLISNLAMAAAVATTAATAPTAAASAPSFCGELGGQWDGQYCRSTVPSERQAVRDIKIAVPGDLVDHPAVGPVIQDYLRTLMNNWKTAGVKMAADSYAEGNYQIFRRGDVLSLVFRETYHADGPDFNNAYRTFAFDMADGRRLHLADLVKPGLDPLTAIPPLAHPFVERALDVAPPPHHPRTYPFVIDRWTPDKVYSGAYKAWALTPDELIIYMPDYPVGRDRPTDFTPGVMQWSMDGGTVQARIPLSALGPVLRPEFGGS